MPAYNNYYPMNYQALYPQTAYTATPATTPTQPTSSIIWVQGEGGAKAYPTAPSTSVLLMDSENSTFYIKTTDASGMPMPLRIFDYAERNVTQTVSPIPETPVIDTSMYVTRDEFEKRLSEVARRSDNRREKNNG